MKKVLLPVCLALLLEVGCAKRMEGVTELPTEASEPVSISEERPFESVVFSSSQRGVSEEKINALGMEQNVSFTDIYFEFDRTNLKPGSRAEIETNGRLLLSNPDLSIQLEGHCDERGTQEYNLALGERRARVVKMYLVSMGLERDRIKILSYGEERSVCVQHREGCWRTNRRVHFAPQ